MWLNIVLHMKKLMRKYDWAKISGILSLLAVDGFIVLGLVAFCTNVTSKMDLDEQTKETADSRKLSFVSGSPLVE